MTVVNSHFAGEPYLHVDLPNYGDVEVVVSGFLAVWFLFWVLIIFKCLGSSAHSSAQPIQTTTTRTTTTRGKNGSSSSSSSSGAKKRVTIVKTVQRVNQTTTGQQQQQKQGGPLVVVALVVFAILGFASGSVVLLALLSPYNSWLPRRVFEAPLLTREECDHIVARSNAAAQRNVKLNNSSSSSDDIVTTTTQVESSLLEEPKGWQKMRHGAYPTTDLNLVTDPFTAQDREYIGSLLDRRLAPLLSRIYGIPVDSIRCNDMFVVRYDAGKRAHLDLHEDDGDVSFNILLTDTFEGGGTRLWKRLPSLFGNMLGGGGGGGDFMELEPFAHAEPTEPGTVITHSALLQHEGYHVQQGTRIILVGFLAVDRTNPWNNQWTGLGWLASYASINWMTVKTKADGFNNEGRRRLLSATGSQQQQQQQRPLWNAGWKSWDRNPFVRYLFNDVLKGVVDWLCWHGVESLVPPRFKPQFLESLDQAFEDTGPQNHERASWFRGQETYLKQQTRAGEDASMTPTEL